jgi:hypothetical protein
LPSTQLSKGSRYTGAAYVARHNLLFIDAMVNKADGIEELLAAMEAFLPRWQQKANSGVLALAALA